MMRKALPNGGLVGAITSNYPPSIICISTCDDVTYQAIQPAMWNKIAKDIHYDHV